MKATADYIHRDLKDSELLNLTKLAAGREIAASLALIDYLLEVDSRKLYATVNNCSSLFDYVVKELGLSEPAAADRVNAVRLIRAVPVVKAHLANGDLTITNAAKIQRSLNAEQKVHPHQKAPSREEKEKIVNACLGKSKREVEKTLFEFQSELAKVAMKEKVRPVTPTRYEIKFTVDETTHAKLNELKELIGNEPLEKIFDQALDALLVLEKKKRGVSAKRTSEASAGTTKTSGQNNANFNRPPKSSEKPNEHNPNEHPNQTHIPTRILIRSQAQLNSRFISVDLKRLVFARSKGQCEYIHPLTHKRCGSRFRLQIDHIIPMALNGRTEASNLRHLCFAHNQLMAMQAGLRTPNESAKYH